MSQTETNPVNNPTIVQNLPNQILDQLPTVQMTDFKRDDPEFVRPNQNCLPLQQMDLIKFAQKARFWKTFTWTASSAAWINEEISMATIIDCLPITMDWQAYLNFTHLEISIKPTSNPYAAGQSYIHWLPTGKYFHSTVYNINLDNYRYWQLSKVPISPKTSDEILLQIPLNFPFQMFMTGSASINNQYYSIASDYMMNYVFGTLVATPYSLLTSTSPTLVELTYTTSIRLVDLRTSGTIVK